MTTKKDNPWVVQTEEGIEEVKARAVNNELQAILMKLLMDADTKNILELLGKMVAITREYYPEFEVPEKGDNSKDRTFSDIWGQLEAGEDYRFVDSRINREDAVRGLKGLHIGAMEERQKEYEETLLPIARKAYQVYTALKGIIEDHEAAIAELQKLRLEKDKEHGDKEEN